MIMKRNSYTIFVLAAIIFGISGCSTSSAEEYKSASEIYEVKDGYYTSDSDKSYILISDGYIELFNYDIDSVLKAEYKKATENKTINSKDLSYEEYYNNSIEAYKKTSGRQEYTLKILPNSTAMLVIESFETGSGGGSYIGYTIVDENTLHGKRNYYSYSGEVLEEQQ